MSLLKKSQEWSRELKDYLRAAESFKFPTFFSHESIFALSNDEKKEHMRNLLKAVPKEELDYALDFFNPETFNFQGLPEPVSLFIGSCQ